jgi:hypothetical protein
MAVITGREPITEFSQWYDRVDIDDRDDGYRHFTVSKAGSELWQQFMFYKREADARLANYKVLEKLADNEVISPKPDLPNVSSGETAGLVRRIARNLVQNTPNVEVISEFDDDKVRGIFARHVLTSSIIGSDQYSNDMQQNLFSSVKTALTLGFDTVIPCLCQDAGGAWYMKYDTIHYRDVFPEPGAKDIREATNVFIRRYLTTGEVRNLCREQVPGWDHHALYTLLRNKPPARQNESVDEQTRKRGTVPDGYEIITWYSNSGEHFLTFEATTMMLLRIEKNKHPLKEHPVHFLVLERDSQQPFGKSQVELLIGRQDFQDLMLNGAMKLWYRNINPSILGFGTNNAIPNLSPGKYTQISNPNAKVEAFEVNTQTLMQYGQISEQNLGSMVNMLGNADQQMAQSAGGGMSATPQGVDAQQQMIDVTQNNYQKAIEGFFSHYCSYALTVYFQEMSAVRGVTPTAEARIRLIKAGLPADQVKPDGTIDIDFSQMTKEYWVRCVPGSLVEMEDEKQSRLLNQLFLPLAQAMQSITQSNDPELIRNSALTLQYIMKEQLRLSGAASSDQILKIWETGDVGGAKALDDRIAQTEMVIGGVVTETEEDLKMTAEAIKVLQAQMNEQRQFNEQLLKALKIGDSNPQPETSSGELEVAV